ncbi:hypothetical protein OFM52_31965, partial [Escherichia coli]|nr:hypothetical protein [Escherichia coli]
WRESRLASAAISFAEVQLLIDSRISDLANSPNTSFGMCKQIINKVKLQLPADVQLGQKAVHLKDVRKNQLHRERSSNF